VPKSIELGIQLLEYDAPFKLLVWSQLCFFRIQFDVDFFTRAAVMVLLLRNFECDLFVINNTPFLSLSVLFGQIMEVLVNFFKFGKTSLQIKRQPMIGKNRFFLKRS